MKKFLSILLALSLLLCATVAFAETAETVMTVMTLRTTAYSDDNGATFTSCDELGSTVDVTLLSDMTAIISMNNSFFGEPEEHAATWKPMEDGSVVITCDGTEIVLIENEQGIFGLGEGEIYAFTYVKDETDVTTESVPTEAVSAEAAQEALVVDASALGNPVAATSLADFDGHWETAYLQMIGYTVSMKELLNDPTQMQLFASMGVDINTLTADIQNGNVTMFGEDMGQFELSAEGALVLNISEAGINLSVGLNLTDTGLLEFELYEGMSYYFTKAE